MKIRILAAIALVVVMAAAVSAFNSNNTYQYGRQDKEYTMAVVAGNVTISSGQWVVLATSDTQSLDTGAVVTVTSTEGAGPCMGVAETSGTGGSLIRIVTRGVTTAYLNGADTGASSAGIAQGDELGITDVAGAAGGVGAGALVPEAIVGYSLATVASTDTGLYNKYSVYVTAR